MLQRRIMLGVLLTSVILAGCAFFRHEIILQEKRGPHGGALAFIDKRLPEYIELAAIPGENKWTFQVYSYNKNMKPRTISGTAYLEIELPDGESKTVGLWNTKRFIWNRGVGHLENELGLGDIQDFSATLILRRRKPNRRDYLKVSYADKTLSFEEIVN